MTLDPKAQNPAFGTPLDVSRHPGELAALVLRRARTACHGSRAGLLWGPETAAGWAGPTGLGSGALVALVRLQRGRVIGEVCGMYGR
ncbi:MAG TPA: hypothetical protein VGP04_10110 [Pseudonocardiaceae bacterium]|nr:hypothetical protein [Pseudonocardiaceae bacterium]